ncbi:MAG: cobalt ECF transporter T component CbiQ [Armatimonadota bacterium]
MDLPDWMSSRARPAVAARSRRRSRPGFVRRAVGAFARLLEEMLTNEGTAEAPGLLQALDARAKVLGLVGLIVIVTLLQRPISLALACGLGLFLGFASRLPLARLARVWLSAPLFTAAIIAPATLNLITPGPPLIALWHPAHDHLGPWALPPAITITTSGLALAGRFLLRVGVCVTFVHLLAATTRPDRLLQGLRALGAPRIFVLLLAMMQRYISVFVRSAQEIHLARLSRTTSLGTTRQEHAWVAAGMGSLLRRTQALGQAIFHSMISRGYTGEARLLAAPRWGTQEWSFLAASACLAILLVRIG